MAKGVTEMGVLASGTEGHSGTEGAAPILWKTLNRLTAMRCALNALAALFTDKILLFVKVVLFVALLPVLAVLVVVKRTKSLYKR